MKPKILLRIASALMLWHAVGHSIGMSGWDKSTDPVATNVISTMKGHAFPFMGAVHSYADSFVGFGLSATVSMLLITILLWLLSTKSASQSKISVSVTLLLFVCLTALCVLEFLYFFPLAAGTTLLAALLTGISYILMKKNMVTA